MTQASGTSPARRTRGGPHYKRTAGLLLAASLVSLFCACLFGPLHVPAADVLSILFTGKATTMTNDAWAVVVRDIRLSRACLSWLVGAGLGVCGVVFQGILRNPLADPFTLGVSSGAAFGAAFAMFLGSLMPQLVTNISNNIGVGNFGILPLAAMAGALLALCAVIMLGRVGGQLKRETLILAGIVVATFLSALISLVKSLDEESVASIVFWIMGSFQGRGWAHVLLFIPYFLLALVIIYRFSRELDLLSLGEIQAKQLGVNVGRVRLLLLISASLATGAAVAVSGVIGFVGLIVPHVVRLAQGAEHRPLLLSSGLLGGILLLWSDVLARTILPQGAELPVGVVTALLGGPFFCFLLRKKVHTRGGVV